MSVHNCSLWREISSEPESEPESVARLLARFFETFAGSNFVTFNYDSLPEIFLHRAKRWYPHDGYGVPVEVERLLGTTDADNRNSTSLVLHLHGSFCVHTSENEIRRNPRNAISWLEPLATPRYSFDPDSISHCFPSYRQTMSSTGYVRIVLVGRRASGRIA